MITECHNRPQSPGVNSNVATKAVEFIHSDEFESITETQLTGDYGRVVRSRRAATRFF